MLRNFSDRHCLTDSSSLLFSSAVSAKSPFTPFTVAVTTCADVRRYSSTSPGLTDVSTDYMGPYFHTPDSGQVCNITVCNQSLEVQLQKIIDDELGAAMCLTEGEDPDEAISRNMQASLRLWNKLTEIKNNYKTELKKKQEERRCFENDLEVATEQICADLTNTEREIERTMQETQEIFAQMAEAERLTLMMNEETKRMEGEIRAITAEDQSLARELGETDRAIHLIKAAVDEVDAEYQRQKAEFEKVLAEAEGAYNEEIARKDQEFAAASAELGRLEQELNDFSQCSPEQMDFERCREELDKLDKENERLKEEILQIQDSNSELRKSRLALLAEGEEEFWKEQQTAKEEETRMAHELELLEKKLRAIEEHISCLEKERCNLERLTAETEAEVQKLQFAVQTIKDQVGEKEKTIREMCEMIEKHRDGEQEMAQKFEEDVRQIRQTNTEKIHEIQCQIKAATEKKQAEDDSQDTFRKLRELTDQYEDIKRQNERSEQVISFYDKVRDQERRYAELKSTLSIAKDKRNFRHQKVNGLFTEPCRPLGSKSVEPDARFAAKEKRLKDLSFTIECERTGTRLRSPSKIKRSTSRSRTVERQKCVLENSLVQPCLKSANARC